MHLELTGEEKPESAGSEIGGGETKTEEANPGSNEILADDHPSPHQEDHQEQPAPVETSAPMQTHRPEELPYERAFAGIGVLVVILGLLLVLRGQILFFWRRCVKNQTPRLL